VIGGCQERGDRAERLADQDGGIELQLFDREHDIGHAGFEGDVVGAALALAVAARVQRDHVVDGGQPGRRVRPLARVAAQAMQEEDRGSGAAEVGGGQPDPLALECQPMYQTPNMIPKAPKAGIRTER
jgi:hypothetical protein